jgi:hypothetical protein
MFGCRSITKVGIVSALCERPTLRSLSFTNYFETENIAMLYELVGNYPSLSEIKMEYTPHRVILEWNTYFTKKIV